MQNNRHLAEADHEDIRIFSLQSSDDSNRHSKWNVKSCHFHHDTTLQSRWSFPTELLINQSATTDCKIAEKNFHMGNSRTHKKPGDHISSAVTRKINKYYNWRNTWLNASVEKFWRHTFACINPRSLNQHGIDVLHANSTVWNSHQPLTQGGFEYRRLSSRS